MNNANYLLTDFSENVYGSRKRLQWIASRLGRAESILEVGCGTGYMITMPLFKCGYDITGIDTSEESIVYGRQIFDAEGLPAETIKCLSTTDIKKKYDAIILSEVLEHLETSEVDILLDEIKSLLNPGGKLLLTVPNGYGCFELENYIWYKFGLGKFIEKKRLHIYLSEIKTNYFGLAQDATVLSSLDTSPHVQRYTYTSIQRELRRNSFLIKDIRGSVLFSGPISHFLFQGVKPILKFNGILGGIFGFIASGYYLHCEVEQVDK